VDQCFPFNRYGKSEGTPSENGLLLDAEAAMEHITNRRDIDQAKIFIHGVSLGGAVAIHAAEKFKKVRPITFSAFFLFVVSRFLT
jgi:dienelactone hydrolase